MLGTAWLVVLMLVMKFLPDSPLGRMLNVALVERPLERLATMDRRHVIYLMILIGLSLFAADMVMMSGSFDLLGLYAWDLTVYLDATMVAFALAAVARGRSVLRWAALRASLLMRRRTASRARRTRKITTKPQGRSANDDDPAPPWSLAA